MLDTVHISPPYTVENVAGTAGAGDTLARVKQMVRSLLWPPTDQNCGGSGAQPQAVAGVLFVFACVCVCVCACVCSVPFRVTKQEHRVSLTESDIGWSREDGRVRARMR